jgi:hypothetical protein
VQVLIGVVTLVIGLALVHSVITAGIGVVGVAVGGVRYVRSRRPNGLPR